jgi:hypothetical protein
MTWMFSLYDHLLNGDLYIWPLSIRSTRAFLNSSA